MESWESLIRTRQNLQIELEWVMHENIYKTAKGTQNIHIYRFRLCVF